MKEYVTAYRSAYDTNLLLTLHVVDWFRVRASDGNTVIALVNLLKNEILGRWRSRFRAVWSLGHFRSFLKLATD